MLYKFLDACNPTGAAIGTRPPISMAMSSTVSTASVGPRTPCHVPRSGARTSRSAMNRRTRNATTRRASEYQFFFVGNESSFVWSMMLWLRPRFIALLKASTNRLPFSLYSKFSASASARDAPSPARSRSSSVILEVRFRDVRAKRRSDDFRRPGHPNFVPPRGPQGQYKWIRPPCVVSLRTLVRNDVYGCFSWESTPSGITTQGCLLRVHMCMSGCNQLVSSSVPGLIDTYPGRTSGL